MKKLLIVVFFCILCSCIYKQPNHPGGIEARNESDEPIYTFLYNGITDSIPLISSWYDLDYIGEKEERSRISFLESAEKPLFSEDGSITLFFLSEEMLRQNSLKEIHQKQIYKKRLVLTKEKLQEMNWSIIYDGKP